MNKKRVCVAGAGITGCTVARLLAEKGYEVTVYERAGEIGGACKDSSMQDTYWQEHGSHIFHTNDKEVWDFLSRFTKWQPYHHKVKALINGELVPIPFNDNSLDKIALSNFDKDSIKRALDNYEYGHEFTLKDLLESNDECLEVLGNFIYENVFRGYSFKQWGEMPDTSVLDRVKAYRHSRDDRYFLDKYQGIPLLGYYTMLVRMMSHENIHINYKKATRETLEKFELCVFTGPIDELFSYAMGELPYRTCTFLTCYYPSPKAQSVPVINYPNDYDFTRVHDYSYYRPSKESVVAYEYPKAFDSKSDKDIRYYPVKNEENSKLYSMYLANALKQCPNTIFAGRLGKYKYMNMDEAVKRAMETVQLILDKDNEQS